MKVVTLQFIVCVLFGVLTGLWSERLIIGPIKQHQLAMSTILDAPVLMPTVEELQRLCIEYGENVKIDNKIGEETLEAMDRIRCQQECDIALKRMSK